MRARILSACAAALFAVACQREKPNEAPVAPLQPLAAVPAPSEPKTPSAAGAPADPLTAPGEEETTGATVDPLAVLHDHRRGTDHFAASEELRAQGDLEGALTEARRAVADLAEDEEALASVGRLARMTGQYELAAQAFERLGSLRHEDAVPRVQQARMLLEAKDYEAAVKAAEAALERDDQNVEAWQVIGRARLSSDDLAAAISAFQTVIDLEPDHGHALNNLGFAYLRANRNEDAVEVLQRAALLLPQVAYVQNNLGVALERTGDVDGARDAFALATSLSPKYVKAHVNAARMKQLASAEGVTDFAGEPIEGTRDYGNLDPTLIPGQPLP